MISTRIRMYQMAQILCIEDNADFLEAVTYELKSVGHKVIESSCGNQGIDLIYEYQPDLVISDILMPKMSGLELLIKLRSGEKNISDTPVIIVSAATQKHYYDQAIRFGVSKFLLKPINWDEFLDTVSSVLKQ